LYFICFPYASLFMTANACSAGTYAWLKQGKRLLEDYNGLSLR